MSVMTLFMELQVLIKLTRTCIGITLRKHKQISRLLEVSKIKIVWWDK